MKSSLIPKLFVKRSHIQTTLAKKISYQRKFVCVTLVIRPKKRNCLFPVLNGPKKNRVGRSVKKILHYFFGQKCVFYACFTLIGS